MKPICLTLLFIILFSCQKGKTDSPVFYKEKQFGFATLRHGFDTSNQWIRRPENIIMLHETFKKIGYRNLISDEEWIENPNLSYSYVKRSLNDMVDSLCLTYDDYTASPKFYAEFWTRRRNEGNQDVVYHVLKEVNSIMNGGNKIELVDSLVDDTLFALLSYEYPLRAISNSEANEMMQFLIKIGLHQSAYNLIDGEVYKFSEVDWDWSIDEMKGKLDKSQKYKKAWFEDDTK